MWICESYQYLQLLGTIQKQLTKHSVWRKQCWNEDSRRHWSQIRCVQSVVYVFNQQMLTHETTESMSRSMHSSYIAACPQTAVPSYTAALSPSIASISCSALHPRENAWFLLSNYSTFAAPPTPRYCLPDARSFTNQQILMARVLFFDKELNSTSLHCQCSRACWRSEVCCTQRPKVSNRASCPVKKDCCLAFDIPLFRSSYVRLVNMHQGRRTGILLFHLNWNRLQDAHQLFFHLLMNIFCKTTQTSQIRSRNWFLQMRKNISRWMISGERNVRIRHRRSG